MGGEDVVFSMSTVRRPEMTRPHSMVTNFGEAEMNLCMFTPDENYTGVNSCFVVINPDKPQFLSATLKFRKL